MKARVLIAEDDSNIRMGLMAALEGKGYTVIAASDGARPCACTRRTDTNWSFSIS
jgi:DNA-binding response OmpR family regulator